MSLLQRFEDESLGMEIDHEFWRNVYTSEYPQVYAQVGTDEGVIRSYLAGSNNELSNNIDLAMVLIRNLPSFVLIKDYSLVRHDTTMRMLLHNHDPNMMYAHLYGHLRSNQYFRSLRYLYEQKLQDPHVGCDLLAISKVELTLLNRAMIRMLVETMIRYAIQHEHLIDRICWDILDDNHHPFFWYLAVNFPYLIKEVVASFYFNIKMVCQGDVFACIYNLYIEDERDDYNIREDMFALLSAMIQYRPHMIDSSPTYGLEFRQHVHNRAFQVATSSNAFSPREIALIKLICQYDVKKPRWFYEPLTAYGLDGTYTSKTILPNPITTIRDTLHSPTD